MMLSNSGINDNREIKNKFNSHKKLLDFKVLNGTKLWLY